MVIDWDYLVTFILLTFSTSSIWFLLLVIILLKTRPVQIWGWITSNPGRMKETRPFWRRSRMVKVSNFIMFVLYLITFYFSIGPKCVCAFISTVLVLKLVVFLYGVIIGECEHFLRFLWDEELAQFVFFIIQSVNPCCYKYSLHQFSTRESLLCIVSFF